MHIFSKKIIPLAISMLVLAAPDAVYALPSHGQFDQTMDELKIAPSGKQKLYIAQLTQWAKEGHTPSQVNLGQMYLLGDFVQKDLRQAYEWTNAAAAKNNPKAQNNLGKMYLRGMGVKKDTLKAYELFGKAAQTGLSDAHYNLGVMFEQGIGVEMYLPYAFGYYLTAVKTEAPQMLQRNLEHAKQGRAIAQNDLGYMYAIGFGTEKNSQQALYWFEQAAKQQLPEAMNNLAVLYDGSGEFVAKNFDPGYYKAIKHYRSSLTDSKRLENTATQVALNRDLANHYFALALKLKHPAAQFNMAKKYETGLGVKTDLQQAVQLYQASIAQGFVLAEFGLARLYLDQNDAVNRAKALPLFESAARKGDSRAMNYAALLSGHMIDIPGWFNPEENTGPEAFQRWVKTQPRDQLTEEDYTEAGIQKLTEQAQRGSASAQYKLAIFRSEGFKYLQQDYAEAEKLFKAAAAQGNAHAIYKLGWLYSREYVPAAKDASDSSLFASHKLGLAYFEAAAAQGVPEAQHELAMTYYAGMGVEKNPALAASYYRQAAASGFPHAVRWINRFKDADRK
ncbi:MULTISPECIES: tetratricopeptide repeat protein [unclassified Acinetobacter]|uniref:tetratricopeptide repeat protein n=1 Tax=unclassified Acinetobacter TaxID=196816 RepID=UPI0015D181C9|nr:MULTISPECIES: tetratricopeptide repeat protein [unclassified Acinetobacter]